LIDEPHLPGPHSAELFRRLRAWNVSSWRLRGRIDAARSALAELAALADAADGRSRPPIPDVSVHGLADQLQVLAMDAFSTGAEPAQVEAVLARLAAALGLRAGQRGGN